MKKYEGRKFSKDQMIFLVESAFGTAWDRSMEMLREIQEDVVSDEGEELCSGAVEGYADYLGTYLPFLVNIVGSPEEPLPDWGFDEINEFNGFVEIAKRETKSGGSNLIKPPDFLAMATKFVEAQFEASDFAE